jgi:hypothetical protein
VADGLGYGEPLAFGIGFDSAWLVVFWECGETAKVSRVPYLLGLVSMPRTTTISPNLIMFLKKVRNTLPQWCSRLEGQERRQQRWVA